MLWLYVLTLGETGARCESETPWLRWEDVDFEWRLLRITSGRDGHRTKAGKSRPAPMTDRLADAIRDHFIKFRFSGSPRVFHHTQSRRHAIAGGRVKSFRVGFEAAVMQAQLPGELHQHDLRHRRVTTWLADGASAVHVQQAIGHADLRTTMAYTHLTDEHIEGLRALEEILTLMDP